MQRNKAKKSRCNEGREAKARKNWETQTKLGTASHAGLASLALARFAFAADQQKRAAAGREKYQTAAEQCMHNGPWKPRGSTRELRSLALLARFARPKANTVLKSTQKHHRSRQNPSKAYIDQPRPAKTSTKNKSAQESTQIFFKPKEIPDSSRAVHAQWAIQRKHLRASLAPEQTQSSRAPKSFTDPAKTQAKPT